MDRDLISKKYGAFPSDEKGRYLWCINCGFSSFRPDAGFCEICGHSLYNFCAHDACGRPCEPYARYCEKCGEPTMLFEKQILWPYDKPLQFAFEEIDTFWDFFCNDKQIKEMDDINWLVKALDCGAYNETSRTLTLLSDDKILCPDDLVLTDVIFKIEWEFSRHLKQTVTIKVDTLK